MCGKMWTYCQKLTPRDRVQSGLTVVEALTGVVEDTVEKFKADYSEDDNRE